MSQRFAKEHRRNGSAKTNQPRPEKGRFPQISRAAFGQTDANAQKRDKHATEKSPSRRWRRDTGLGVRRWRITHGNGRQPNRLSISRRCKITEYQPVTAG